MSAACVDFAVLAAHHPRFSLLPAVFRTFATALPDHDAFLGCVQLPVVASATAASLRPKLDKQFKLDTGRGPGVVLPKFVWYMDQPYREVKNKGILSGKAVYKNDVEVRDSDTPLSLRLDAADLPFVRVVQIAPPPAAEAALPRQTKSAGYTVGQAGVGPRGVPDTPSIARPPLTRQPIAVDGAGAPLYPLPQLNTQLSDRLRASAPSPPGPPSIAAPPTPSTVTPQATLRAWVLAVTGIKPDSSQAARLRVTEEVVSTYSIEQFVQLLGLTLDQATALRTAVLQRPRPQLGPQVEATTPVAAAAATPVVPTAAVLPVASPAPAPAAPYAKPPAVSAAAAAP